FGMGVKDDVQGLGVGSALLKTVIDLADNWLNLKRIELTVYVDNERAINLYKKFGFVIEGESKDYAFRNGSYVDVYHMARVVAHA
ncbi:TPA: GNAT family N-acetyltransferase, partial [Vibrio cholerae]